MMQQQDERLAEFVRRCDFALETAEAAKAKVRGRKAFQLESYELLITNLKGIRQGALEGEYRRVSRGEVRPGAGLGMGMFLSEWCDNEAVLKACKAAEDYFRYEF